MKKLLIALSLLGLTSSAFAVNGTVTLIDKLAPQNGAFVGLVDSSQTLTNVTNFNNNLSGSDTDVQKALDTLDNLVIGGGGTPGGSNTNVQYNNSGAFGGNSGFQYDSSVSSVSIGGRLKVTDNSNLFKFGDGSSDPNFTIDDENGSPGGSFIFQSFGTPTATFGRSSGDFRVTVTTNGSITPSPRLLFPTNNQTTQITNTAGSPIVQFDPVGNSSFTIPVVLATVLSASSLATDSTGKIIAGSAGSSGASALAVGTGTASNFTTKITSPTAAISFLGSQFLDTTNGTTSFIALNQASVTVQGVLTAGSNITLTPSAGTLTIAASGVGGSASGVSGAVQYSDGAGGFVSNDATFHFTGNALGIGTNSPGGTLEIIPTVSDNSVLSVRGAGNNNSQQWLTGGGVVQSSVSSSGVGYFPRVEASTFNVVRNILVNGQAGSSGQVLQSNGAGSANSWVTLTAGGDAFLANDQAFTGQNSWTTAKQSTFTYGVTIGSITFNPNPGNQRVLFLNTNGQITTNGVFFFNGSTMTSTNLSATGLITGSTVNALSGNFTQVTAISSITANKFFGDGSNLTSIPAAAISAGSLGASVLASSFTATGVTAGSYTNTNLTVDAQGRISSASNGSAGGGSSTLAVGTGTATNFTNKITSPTAAIDFEGLQFKSAAIGTTNYLSLNLSSVTVQGTLLAGSNVTLTPGAGTLTIAATSSGGTSILAIGTGTASNFNTAITSPTAAISVLPAQFSLTTSGTTSFWQLNSASVTLQGQNVLSLSSASATYLNQLSPYVSSANVTAALTVTANGTAGSTPQFGVNSSSVTTYGMNIPAAAISAGSLGASVLASSLTATGVTAGSYTNTNLTVDAQGRISVASNGSAGSSVTIYKATSTAGFPLGMTVSTMNAEGAAITITTTTNVNAILTVTSTSTTNSQVGTGFIVYSSTNNAFSFGVSTGSNNSFVVAVSTSGDVRDASNSAGTVGKVYTSNGSGAGPTWQSVSSILTTSTNAWSAQQGFTSLAPSTFTVLFVSSGNFTSLATSTDAAHPVPKLSSCETGPSLSAGATDISGTVTVGSGSGTSCTLTFGSPKAKAPPCIVSGNSTSITLSRTVTTTTLVVGGSSSVGNLEFSYICLPNQ